ncbi:MAG: hypothetical protein ABIR59_03330, partial [Gemmatimonadales bacterium]
TSAAAATPGAQLAVAVAAEEPAGIRAAQLVALRVAAWALTAVPRGAREVRLAVLHAALIGLDAAAPTSARRAVAHGKPGGHATPRQGGLRPAPQPQPQPREERPAPQPQPSSQAPEPSSRSRRPNN